MIEKEKSFKELILILILIIINIIAQISIGGFIFLKFWDWFLLPAFPEMPKLTYGLALGLSVFPMLFRNKNTNNILKNKEYKGQHSVNNIIALIIILSFGWIIHLIII
jgi:hypothetical protein